MITSDLYVVPLLLRGAVSAEPDAGSQAKPHKGTPFEGRLHDRECGEGRAESLRLGRSCPRRVRQLTQTCQLLAGGQVARDGDIAERNYAILAVKTALPSTGKESSVAPMLRFTVGMRFSR